MNPVRNQTHTANDIRFIGLSLLLAFFFLGCDSGVGGGDVSSSSLVPSSSSVEPSSSSLVPSSSSSTGSLTEEGIVYGESVTYEGETYQTVVIGTQTWFARNLNYAAEGSRCYDDEPANCVTYGRLYDWAMAMALPSDCNTTACASQMSSKHKGICPSGWHIPNNAEWVALYHYADSTSYTSDLYYSPSAGRYLKATGDWGGSGEDRFGFAALPGGNYVIGYFDDVGSYGRWWSATENNSINAYEWYLRNNTDAADWSFFYKTYFFSVRCVKD